MNKAVITKNSDGFYVVFGREYNGELIVSHTKVGRGYSTKAGAEKAKKEWESK